MPFTPTFVASWLSLLSTAFLAYFVNAYFRHKKWADRITYGLPGPSLDNVSLLAHLGTLVSRRNDIPSREDDSVITNIPNLYPILKNLQKEYNKDGLYRTWGIHPYNIFTWFLSVPSVYLLDPYLIQQFLKDKDITRHLVKVKNIYKTAESLIGDSFLTMPDHDPHWKIQRKLTAAAFNTNLLELTNRTVVKLLNEQVYSRLEGDDPNSSSPPIIECVELCLRFTVEVLGLVGFGTEFNSLDYNMSGTHNSNNKDKHDKNEHARSLFDAFQIILNEILTLLPLPLFMRWFRPRDQMRFFKAKHTLNSTIRTIIDQRQQEYATNKDKELLPERSDILSQMLKSNTMSPHDVHANVRMMLFAGHDTTGAVLVSALWEIAKNPTVQEKLQQELDNFFASNDSSIPTYQSINSQLKYLNAVIIETLRKHPTAHVGRTTTAEITLKHQDGREFHIPEKCAVFVTPVIAQNDESYCADPQDFRPERFLNDGNNSNVSRPDAPYYMPFSMGPRHCVGNPLATAELKVTLAHLVHRYNIAPAPDFTKVWTIISITNRPHAVRLQFHKRN